MESTSALANLAKPMYAAWLLIFWDGPNCVTIIWDNFHHFHFLHLLLSLLLSSPVWFKNIWIRWEESTAYLLRVLVSFWYDVRIRSWEYTYTTLTYSKLTKPSLAKSSWHGRISDILERVGCFFCWLINRLVFSTQKKEKKINRLVWSA